MSNVELTNTARLNGSARTQTDETAPQPKLIPQLQRRQVLVTRVGLEIPADTTFDGWKAAGQQLSRIVDSSAWCLGDWLVYGKSRYADRYLHVIQLANLDYQTLRNYAWVARRYSIERRRQSLSFQHHAEAASLPQPEQDHWLDEAEKHGWSRNQLRRQIRMSRAGEVRSAPSNAVLPRLYVPGERFRRWRAAADHSRIDFEAWILDALDTAATQTLTVDDSDTGEDPAKA
ncbi:LmbU family transcriptional regulator [Micromonospora sp. NPDC048935]|uniref:LmbU family transcriptional regulator n=1 Tax=Micromonospora sp. NPDC048935 TaxID=3364262 RepID=UPI00371348FC